MKWVVRLQLRGKPDGAHSFKTKREAFAFYVKARLALRKSTFNVKVERPLKEEK